MLRLIQYSLMALLAIAELGPARLGHATEKAGDSIVVGVRYSVNSKSMSQRRDLWISLPSDYDPDSDVRYPVLYLVDGENNIQHAVSSVRYLSGNAGYLPDFIIVGVIHQNRGDEMRPTFPSSGEKNNNERLFRSFITEELVQFIDASFNTQPYRVLFGHSLGGLFALNVLRASPGVFDSYIASSPALWWEDGEYAAKMAQSLGGIKFDQTSLVMTTADEGVESDSLFNAFSSSAEELDANGLNFSNHRFPGYSHNTVAPVALNWSMLKMFEGWTPDRDVYRQGLQGLIGHYQALSRRFGWEVQIPADTLSSLTFDFARRGAEGDEEKVAALVVYAVEKDAEMVTEISELIKVLEIQNQPVAAQMVRKSLCEIKPTVAECRDD